MVQEEDVNTVGVPRDNDGEELAESLGGFAPGSAGHGAGVINKENCIEGGQKCIRIFLLGRGA